MRDLKHRVPAKSPRPSRTAPWFWMVGGILLTLVVTVLPGWLRSQEEVKAMPVSGAVQGSAPSPNALLEQASSSGEGGEASPPPKPRLTFYQTLPGVERTLDESAINAEERKVGLGKKVAEGRFYLQLGAFTEQAEAERLKEQIESMLETRPQLELIQMEYTAWYRVRVGPYRTLLDADKVRKYLREGGVDAIIQIPES